MVVAYSILLILAIGAVLFTFFLLCRYRLRSKVEIDNVAEDFSCWQLFGGNLAEKSNGEEPEAASAGWGPAVDHSAMSSSRGNDVGWQWFKDPRVDCLGLRGVFPSKETREFPEPSLVA